MNQPIYAKNNPAYRIAYVANGLWRVQEHSNLKGNKTFDPWVNNSPALSKDEALAVLSRHNRETKAA